MAARRGECSEPSSLAASLQCPCLLERSVPFDRCGDLRSRAGKEGAFFRGENGCHCGLGWPVEAGDGEYLKDAPRVFFSRTAGWDNGLEDLAVFHSLFCVLVDFRFLLAGLQPLVSLCRQRPMFENLTKLSAFYNGV
jgi:hypothetical protein